MTFQTSVENDVRSGVIGEMSHDVPSTVITGVVDSGAGSANNIIGRALTYIDKNLELFQAGGDGDSFTFAGLLALPKTHALRGVAGDTLAESLLLPDGEVVELMQEGEMYVSLASDGGTIGDTIFYDDTTGALDYGTAAAGQTQIVGATIVRHVPSPTAAGEYLAIVRIKP